MIGVQMKNHHRVSHVAFLAVALLLAACATGPEVTPQLEEARAAYQEAAAMENVSQYAPVVLKESREALEQAEQAEEDVAVNHFAYLAQRRAELAMELAGQQAARQRVEALTEERQQLRLQVRERQAERARQEAQEQEQATATARQQVAQLEEQVASLKAEQTDRGTVFTLQEKDVFFETGKADLEPGAMRQITKLAGLIQRYPDRRIVVEGYTDSTGPAELNQRLSQQRAQSVAEVLVAQGVSPDRIITRGYGENFPVASNQTQAGRLQNRRVEVVLLNGGQAATQRQP